MKIGIKVGDKVRVLKGKFAGKEDTVAFIDKQTARVRLTNLKKAKIKTKKGQSKELHGTFALSTLKPLQVEAAAPAGEQAAG